jgi:hypothetical protein
VSAGTAADEEARLAAREFFAAALYMALVLLAVLGRVGNRVRGAAPSGLWV